MKVEIKIPVMGESVAEAIIGTIFKPSGSIVSQDEELLELETDKVNQVLNAPQSGELTLTVQTGDHIPVGVVIGTIDTSKAKAEAKKEEPQPEKPQPPPPKKESQEGARHSVDAYIQEISQPPQKTLSLPAKPEKPRPDQPGVKRKKMSNLRKIIAEKLVQVKNDTAMLTTFNEVDMTAVMELRAREKDHFQKRFGVKLGFMSFFVKASITALKAFPAINAFIEGDEIVYHDTYHIGIAVSTDRGLFVPVVRDCDKLSYAHIESAIEAFAKKAREGTISISDLQGGSFTITNGGVFGSLLSTPILNPPQSGILGMHKIQKRPVVVDDQIVIRPMMYLALSYDHRIVDGKEAVSFLVALKENLEDPGRLLLDL
jgi:2-oxoglutarate dehydrogenase E2 component (dihydrolipoamide succinyltransferase)